MYPETSLWCLERPAHFARMGPDLFEASGMSVECLVEAKNLCGESPVWHAEHESVYWTDINGFKDLSLLRRDR